MLRVGFLPVLLLAKAALAADQPFPDAAPMPERPKPQPTTNLGPWSFDVLVYHATRSGTVSRVATFERAGVPTVTRLSDGRLLAAYQYFPTNNATDFDKVAVRLSVDQGRIWTEPRTIRLTGLPDGMRFPFDPTLVALPDGRVRLYFTSVRGRTFQDDTPAIYSAISSNGLDYVVEPGIRFGIAGRLVIDCAVALHRGTFHLFAPDNGTPTDSRGPPPRSSGIGYHATSPDGLAFTRVDDVQAGDGCAWLGNAQSDGKSITFIGTGAPAQPVRRGERRSRGGVWMARSANGATWSSIECPPVPGPDPGAVELDDGSWIFLTTGPLRSDATGERPFAPAPPARPMPPPRDGMRPADRPAPAW
jgi:hypothetical protein